jgi:hypothetical protein
MFEQDGFAHHHRRGFESIGDLFLLTEKPTNDSASATP